MQRAFEGISAGNTVVSADGEKLGTIAALRGTYLLVEKGLFFVDDYHVPMSAIDHYAEDEGEVHLNVTKDEALASGWEQEPDDPLLDLTGSPTVLTGAAETPNPAGILEIEIEDD
jgi:hypothetical protein